MRTNRQGIKQVKERKNGYDNGYKELQGIINWWT